MFESMHSLRAETSEVAFCGVVGGTGPAVLMLHGFPQTHLTWRRVAPALAEKFSLVIPDLPGYGDSVVLQNGGRWTKRRVAAALVELMAQLGHETFTVVGHDRGARVGYRLALDHPDRVRAYATLTVIPSLDVWAGVDKTFGIDAFHWYFLAQPHDLPERLLAGDPDAFLDAQLANMAGSLDRFEPEVLQAYRAAFRRPSVRHAMCEDYRAGASEDADHDAEDRRRGRKMPCPVLVLWPQSQSLDPREVWRRWADDVNGEAISGGHLQPEFSAPEVLANLAPFLQRAAGLE